MVTNLVESEETVWELRPRFEKTDAVGLPAPDIEVHSVVNAVAREVAPSVA